MCSRKAAKISASILLVVGNVLVWGFLGFLIFYTTLLTPILRSFLSVLIGGGAVLLVPQYLMVVSYKIGSVFGLFQIHMTKRRWIDVVKLFADLVFLLSAGATMLIIVFALVITGSAVSLLSLIPAADLIFILIITGCYFSSLLVWKCSKEEPTTDRSDHQTHVDTSNEEGLELQKMSKF